MRVGSVSSGKLEQRIVSIIFKQYDANGRVAACGDELDYVTTPLVRCNLDYISKA